MKNLTIPTKWYNLYNSTELQIIQTCLNFKENREGTILKPDGEKLKNGTIEISVLNGDKNYTDIKNIGTINTIDIWKRNDNYHISLHITCLNYNSAWIKFDRLNDTQALNLLKYIYTHDTLQFNGHNFRIGFRKMDTI